MSFFNSKEEVINIELTQYGKEQFSKGLFKPTYYEFFDDEIIYDSNWGGLSENQNSIETRILEESIYLKPVYNFSDRMKANDKYYFFKSQPKNVLNTKDPIPVSTNRSENNYTPAWDLKILNGAAVSYSTSSYQNILQVQAKNLNVFVSGTSIQDLDVKVEDLLIDLEEINCLSGKENFEIELFEVENELDFNNNPKLKQITFGKQPIYIKDGILLDKPLLPDVEPELNPSNVEYYFKISTDKKIDTLTLKDLKEKQKNIYANSVIGE